ncbi:hypothetical protein [uncultured Pseudomonas sp.]|uniref:hypothetical protein n=1 Tax=uncultured Pseudomonas sp. TaxID=114707 RepID=UPI0025CB93C1|nr:hypothetical protein [uncultured Pseudomonas sp.]
MSKLKEFRDLEHALKRQQEKLERLAHNEQLSRLLEFEQKLLALLKRYKLTLRDLKDVAQANPLCTQEDSARYGATGHKTARACRKRTNGTKSGGQER